MDTLSGSRRTSRMDPIVYDTILAVSLTVFSWGQALALPVLFRARTGGGMPEPFGRVFMVRETLSPLTFVLIGACFLPLAFRRRAPLAVLTAVTLAAALYDLLPHPPAVTVFAVLIAVYTVGTVTPRGQLVVAASLSALALLLTSLPPVETPRLLGELVRVVAMVGLAAAAGDAVRNQRAYVSEVEHRAQEAERTREEETRRRVARGHEVAELCGAVQRLSAVSWCGPAGRPPGGSHAPGVLGIPRAPHRRAVPLGLRAAGGSRVPRLRSAACRRGHDGRDGLGPCGAPRWR